MVAFKVSSIQIITEQGCSKTFFKPLFNFSREKVTTVFCQINHFKVKKRWYVKNIGYGFGSEKLPVFVSEQVKKDPDITDHNTS
jgi:hypothetical protein